MEITNIISIWGAISGTLGTVVAGYAVWLSKKSQNSKIILEKVTFREIKKGSYGTSIDFIVSVSNIGFKPTVVTGFYLDLGKKLNTKYEEKETKSSVGLVKFHHIRPMGTKIDGKVTNVPIHNETIHSLPGSHEGPIHLGCHIMYGGKDDGEFSNQLNELIKSNKFKISICTTGNKFTSFSGKSLHWELAT